MAQRRNRREMSESEMKDAEEMFNLFDKNRNGRIEVGELQEAMFALWLNPTPQEVEEQLASFARESQDSLTKDEFLDFMSYHQSAEESQADLEEAFRQFDKDGSGEIDIDELRQRLGEIGCDIDEAHLQEMMQEADQNGDGKIDIKEFAAIMMNQQ